MHAELPLLVPNPRSVNQLRSLDSFVSRWDSGPDPGFRLRYHLRRSSAGNINKDGREGGLLAPALPHWHNQFDAALEPGVASLLHACIDGGRWISYTSCEGHLYTHGPSPAWRHVGLLPRDADEHSELESRLVEVVRQSRAQHPDASALATVARGVLDDRGAAYRVLDLYLLPRAGVAHEQYFASVELVSEGLIRALTETR